MDQLMTFGPLLVLLFGILIMYLFGRFCSRIAESKGYDKRTFFWLGAFFTIPALIIISVMPDQRL
jgi:hypothetical protein